ncbi:MAG: NmrA family NAD(P)-binding protein [Pseudonocardiaceae bacterium]
MILVTGATGKVGSEAVRLLRQHELPVRALVRSPEKAAALVEVGAEIAEGDLEAQPTIDEAMQGATSVVLVSPGAPMMELNVIQSAVRAGVGHVVKISAGSASADSPIARRREHAQIEDALTGSGLNYTLLRPNVYMQNIFALAPMIAKTDGFASSHGAGRLGMIDARDVAAVAAKIAASPATHRGKTYPLTGPELLSYVDVGAVLSKVLDRPITYRELSFEEDREAMIRAGLPEPIAEMNAQAFRLVAAGGSAWLTEDVPSVLGRPARSFEQFATDYATAFS